MTGVSTRESATLGSAVVNAWRQMEKPQAVVNRQDLPGWQDESGFLSSPTTGIVSFG